MESAWLSEPNKNSMGVFVCNPVPVHLQVVLAHPPASLALVQRGPVRKVFRHRIFSFRGTCEEVYTLTFFLLKKGSPHKTKFNFLRNFLIFLEYPSSDSVPGVKSPSSSPQFVTVSSPSNEGRTLYHPAPCSSATACLRSSFLDVPDKVLLWSRIHLKTAA